MLVQLTCSGEKLLPYLPIGYRSKTTKGLFLHLPHRPHHHRFMTPCLLLPPSSMTIKSRPPQDHYVVVVQFAFRIGPLTTHVVEPRPINLRLTPHVPLLPAPDSRLDDSEDLGMVRKPCGMRSSRLNYGSA